MNYTAVEKENLKLSELRNRLLPMLMDGQISVGEAGVRMSAVAEERERNMGFK